MKTPDPASPKGVVTRADALACRPEKNSGVTEQRLESGDVVLSYPVVMRPWFARLARRLGGPEEPVRTRKLQLDALGTGVWDLMDGSRTVLDIITAFARIHKLYPKEAEVSVTLFLRDLGKRGIIGLR